MRPQRSFRYLARNLYHCTNLSNVWGLKPLQMSAVELKEERPVNLWFMKRFNENKKTVVTEKKTVLNPFCVIMNWILFTPFSRCSLQNICTHSLTHSSVFENLKACALQHVLSSWCEGGGGWGGKGGGGGVSNSWKCPIPQANQTWTLNCDLLKYFKANSLALLKTYYTIILV